MFQVFIFESGVDDHGYFVWKDTFNLKALTVLQLQQVINQKISVPVKLLAIENVPFDDRYPLVRQYARLTGDKQHNKILKIFIDTKITKVC